MNKRYFIPQEKMLAAKKDPEIMKEIIIEISGAINYIAMLAYTRFYSIDNSTDYDDIRNIISMEIMKSIKNSYNIEKEKKGYNVKAYRNGYSFINKVFKYILHNFKMKRLKKRTIQPNYMSYYDSDDEKIKLHLKQQHPFQYGFIEDIILKKINKKEQNIRLFNVVQKVLKATKHSKQLSLIKYKDKLKTIK